MLITTLIFSGSKTPFDFKSLKKAVRGWIVKTSKDCTRYISWQLAKYASGVVKSQSINTNEWFWTNVDNIGSALEKSPSSPGFAVYTVKFLLTWIPSANPFFNFSIDEKATFLKLSSFFVYK